MSGKQPPKPLALAQAWEASKSHQGGLGLSWAQRPLGGEGLHSPYAGFSGSLPGNEAKAQDCFKFGEEQAPWPGSPQCIWAARPRVGPTEAPSRSPARPSGLAPYAPPPARIGSCRAHLLA